MTKSQSELARRLQRQGALIEKVCAARGFSYQELGERIGVSRETIRKYAGGYQPASARVMGLIAKQLTADPAQELIDAKATASDVGVSAGSEGKESALTKKLLYVLERGTAEEGALVRAMIEAAHRNIAKREAER